MFRPKIIQADLTDNHHQESVLRMMDAYASDPMGDGKPLSDFARRHLIAGLIHHPTTLIFLAMQENEPCGIAVCFRGYSTFAAKPLIHVSDFYVDPALRGQGIGMSLLRRIEQDAVQTGCCKIVLEVQEHNSRARSVYSAFGFSQAVYVKEAGGSLSMSKSLLSG
ncbi:MAG: GNAT family N-acetyltransferase [Planctomycetales bacterium]|nr:GNAT family N-acetyltransferase [Planctomycetales bacterium]